MFYARHTNNGGELWTVRFYNRAERDAFCAQVQGAEPVRSKSAKYIPGADRCITYSGQDAKGAWLPV